MPTIKRTETVAPPPPPPAPPKETKTHTPERTESTFERGQAGQDTPTVGTHLKSKLESGGILKQGSSGVEVKEMQQLLNRAGANPPLEADGKFGAGTERAVRAFQESNGLKADGKFGRQSMQSLDASLQPGTARPAEGEQTTQNNPANPSSVEGYQPSQLTYTQNANAVKRAEETGLGKRVPEAMEKYGETYKKASALTGVPAELIAAVHANESQFGTYKASTNGPESGFGLDDRFVKTSWANEKLAEHGLGKWERGKPSENGVLQSAVVAAEHLKRNAAYAGVTLKPEMSQNELAAAVTSYVAGPGAGKKALRRGTSWLFKPSDSNPHPLHPGGTSRGPGGRTIRVKPSRKPGLLRWDALLPLIQKNL
ncbi:MAG: hypothetical protein CL920_12975 [Deltaproteobacteria bacterium]|nr:hypothetical protein [Deltaproteobacteria bacterium]|tara:strand:- start:38280 stop:39386 length:1107 start_codon:yes stop_codon:yes gene_type:complete